MRRCRSRRRGSAVGAQPCRSCSRRDLIRVPQIYCEGKDDTGGLQKQAEACGTAAHRLHRQVAIAAEWLLQQRRGCSRLNAWATLPSQRCGSCGRHGHVGGAQNGLRGQCATAAMQLLQQACMLRIDCRSHLPLHGSIWAGATGRSLCRAHTLQRQLDKCGSFAKAELAYRTQKAEIDNKDAAIGKASWLPSQLPHRA